MSEPALFFYQVIASPLGELIVASTKRGICLISFLDTNSIINTLKTLDKADTAIFENQENEHIASLISELKLYFAGELKVFTIPLEMFGSPFQIKVWNELLLVDYGDKRSYKEQSLNLGNVLSIRAVANANGKNKIAIVVPCHRIIGSNGKLVGYSGSLWRKKFLLELENNNSIKQKFDLFSAQ